MAIGVMPRLRHWPSLLPGDWPRTPRWLRGDEGLGWPGEVERSALCASQRPFAQGLKPAVARLMTPAAAACSVPQRGNSMVGLEATVPSLYRSFRGISLTCGWSPWARICGFAYPDDRPSTQFQSASEVEVEGQRLAKCEIYTAVDNPVQKV